MIIITINFKARKKKDLLEWNKMTAKIVIYLRHLVILSIISLTMMYNKQFSYIDCYYSKFFSKHCNARTTIPILYWKKNSLCFIVCNNHFVYRYQKKKFPKNLLKWKKNVKQNSGKKTKKTGSSTEKKDWWMIEKKITKWFICNYLIHPFIYYYNLGIFFFFCYKQFLFLDHHPHTGCCWSIDDSIFTFFFL